MRVVSMPSTTEFDKQSQAYRQEVLPKTVPLRLAIEAGATGLWHRYTGDHGLVLGLDSFGESAPAAQVYEYFNLTVEYIVAQAQTLLSISKAGEKS